MRISQPLTMLTFKKVSCTRRFQMVSGCKENRLASLLSSSPVFCSMPTKSRSDSCGCCWNSYKQLTRVGAVSRTWCSSILNWTREMSSKNIFFPIFRTSRISKKTVITSSSMGNPSLVYPSHWYPIIKGAGHPRYSFLSCGTRGKSTWACNVWNKKSKRGEPIWKATRGWRRLVWHAWAFLVESLEIVSSAL